MKDWDFEMERLQWNQFGSISDVSGLAQYLEGRQYEHGYYYHYTSLNAINGILGSRTFRISNISRFNDRAELKYFTDPQYWFSLCFSTGLNENLPLWYLYSGLSGHGGRIGFTANAIRRLIDTATFELAECDNCGNPTETCIGLEKGKSMNIDFRDVVYYGAKSNSNLDLKYNTMTNHIIPLCEESTLIKQFGGFLKSLIWYYEKETRLLIKVIGSVAESIQSNRSYCVLMHFDEKVYKSVRLTLAPEVVDVSIDLVNCPAIQQFILDTSKVKNSLYQGEISMNLCGRCSKIQPVQERKEPNR